MITLVSLRVFKFIDDNIEQNSSIANLTDFTSFTALTGKVLDRVSNDDVDDVRFHSDQLFSVSGVFQKEHKVRIHVYETQTWKCTNRLQSTCCWALKDTLLRDNCKYRLLHTLFVCSDNIAVACRDTGRIYAMTHKGWPMDLKLFDIKFDYPMLCHTSSNALFVADEINHWLLMEQDGEWENLCKPSHSVFPFPRDLVYVGGSLFVLSFWNWTSHILKCVRNL